jgi:hypothetical protein
MQCSFCDAPLPGSARYCPNCGTPLANAASGQYMDLKSAGYDAPSGGNAYASGGPWSRGTSTLAVVSFVAGIAAWFAVPLLAAIAAVITGHMARREIRQSAGRLDGDWMAVIGLVLGYAQLIIVALVVSVIVLILSYRFLH